MTDKQLDCEMDRERVRRRDRTGDIKLTVMGLVESVEGKRDDSIPCIGRMR